MQPELVRKMTVEAVGAFALSFIGVGAILYGPPGSLVTVALAHGFVIAVMVCAAGHISGGHFNPAVTLGLWSAGRCATSYVIPYIIAQVIAAIAAAAVLWVIASSHAGWVAGGFASNGYGDLSPGKYSLGSCFLIEVLVTLFLYVRLSGR